MTEESEKTPPVEELRELTENPYDPRKSRPEDIVRLFYVHSVPIIPVISKRGVLIGILKKDDVIAELSDIERVEKLSTDTFITSLARMMTFDDLLQYGTIREFTVINIFGEVQGAWPRLALFGALEKQGGAQPARSDVAEQKDQQMLEWIIYLVLEHIPRGLYAVNSRGKTIFYNSHFEEAYEDLFRKALDADEIEGLLKNPSKNELVTSPEGQELCFYNRDLALYYEKVPMMNKKKNLGYLIFSLKESEVRPGLRLPGVDIRGMSLGEMIEAFERWVIVGLLNEKGDLAAVASTLKLTGKALRTRMAKLGVDYDPGA
jgi:transcriptional regulator with PAS, ATPase and Fis domain